MQRLHTCNLGAPISSPEGKPGENPVGTVGAFRAREHWEVAVARLLNPGFELRLTLRTAIGPNFALGPAVRF